MKYSRKPLEEMPVRATNPIDKEIHSLFSHEPSGVTGKSQADRAREYGDPAHRKAMKKGETDDSGVHDYLARCQAVAQAVWEDLFRNEHPGSAGDKSFVERLGHYGHMYGLDKGNSRYFVRTVCHVLLKNGYIESYSTGEGKKLRKTPKVKEAVNDPAAEPEVKKGIAAVVLDAAKPDDHEELSAWAKAKQSLGISGGF
jgi:hypothetical protein